MANSNQISIKVCGNPDANGGFQPMVIFNSPSIEIKDTFYTGFDANSYFFTIKIEKNQVVYKLIKNNVSSLGASRQGSLVIGIAIPKGYKLDAGKSPYDVLIALKEAFLARCMTCKDAATEKYEFSSNHVSPDILDDIAGAFTLVPAEMPHRMMHGTSIAYVTVAEDLIKQLMEDVQYPAFENFSEVVVAETVQNTIYSSCPNVKIPREPEYSIYDDGKLIKTTSDKKESITIQGKKDSRYYNNESIEFTIERLLNGETFSHVSIDKANEKIHVSSKALTKPRSQKIKVVFKSKEAQDYFSSHTNNWILQYNSKKISLENDLSFYLAGEDLKYLETPNYFEIKIFGTSQYKVGKFCSVLQNQICFTANKDSKTTGPKGGSNKSGGQPANDCEIRLHMPKSWIKSSEVEIILKYKNEFWESTQELSESNDFYVKDFERKSLDFFNRYSRVFWVLTLLIVSLLTGCYFGANVCQDWFGNDTISTDSISCKVCENKFVSQAGLSAHMSRKHADTDISTTDKVKNLHCEDCNDGPFDNDELDSHKSNCPKKVKCDKCDQRFASNSDLEAHKSAEHLVISYDCSKCSKTFTSSDQFNKHISDEHTQQECQYCHKLYENKKALNAHISKDHHFTCEECGPNRWYHTEKELKDHQRRDKVDGTNFKHHR